ncbi:GDSL esterase/lipase At4g10955 [Cryptomeria japonica]|uniref:GDSL esterase/lipase At4g10955 n=1 Tax=Cryptomeria japonica TaxID=3369 RepID=UPI0027D9E696|nr:GDSL esterase/lipase At4g10955 [Cryptomeria japonica]
MADVDAILALANPDWNDPNDKRCIAACLVNVVYQLEKGKEKEEMANECCKLLEFKVYEKIMETRGGQEVIFGAVFQWVGKSRRGKDEGKPPSEVVAFRGTIPKGKDFLHNWKAANACHKSISRGDIGLQYLQRCIKRHGPHNIWIVGHSLGAAIATVAARKMGKEERNKMEAHLFNPPFLSPRLPELTFFEMVGRNLAAVRDIWRSLGFGAPNALDFMMIDDEKLCALYNDFIGVSGWNPNIYVGKNDPVSCSYIRYFEVMGAMYKDKSKPLHERMKYLFSFEVAQETTPVHLLPSANLFVKDSGIFHPLENHCLRQWWSRNINLKVKAYVAPVNAPRTQT